MRQIGLGNFLYAADFQACPPLLSPLAFIFILFILSI